MEMPEAIWLLTFRASYQEKRGSFTSPDECEDENSHEKFTSNSTKKSRKNQGQNILASGTLSSEELGG